jgi:hypothetical protein
MIRRKPRRPALKRKDLDIPPDVARRFYEYMRAFHAESNPIKADRIAGDVGHLLRQHYRGRLRLPDVKRMFEQMRVDGED